MMCSYGFQGDNVKSVVIELFIELKSSSCFLQKVSCDLQGLHWPRILHS